MTSSPDSLPAWRVRLAWLAILGVAAAVRLPSITAGYPYLNYVDEGHVLHRVEHVLRSRDWDPGWYIYGALPNYAILGAVYLYSPIYRLAHGRSVRDDLPVNRARYYDRIGPPELLLLARAVGLLLSLGTVALAGWLAARLAGTAAGLLAGWLAALLPALVIRGGVVNVDVYATFFVLAALCFAEPLRRLGGSAGKAVKVVPGGGDGEAMHGEVAGQASDLAARPGEVERARSVGRRAAVLAGAMTGLALVSKYPQVLVALSVAAAVLLAPRALVSWSEKLRRLALAGGAAVLAAAVGMPALVLRTGQVVKAVAYEASLYAGTGWGSYWDQAVRRAEWDQPLAWPELGWPFLLLAGVALAAALADRETRGAMLVWTVYAAALGWLLSRYGFRPFRNLLSLVPLLAVLVGCLYGRLRRRPAVAARPAARRWLAAAAAALPLALFAAPDAAYVRHQLRLVDSRHQATLWLAAHATPGDTSLFAQELAFLPSEMQSVPGASRELPWQEARSAIAGRCCRFAVLGDYQAAPGLEPIAPQVWRDEVLAGYEVRAAYGEDGPNGLPQSTFHGNRQHLWVLERRPEAPHPADRLPAKFAPAPPARVRGTGAPGAGRAGAPP